MCFLQPYEFIVGAEPGKERKREFVDSANGLFSAQAAPKPPPALYNITEGMRVGGKVSEISEVLNTCILSLLSFWMLVGLWTSILQVKCIEVECSHSFCALHLKQNLCVRSTVSMSPCFILAATIISWTLVFMGNWTYLKNLDFLVTSILWGDPLIHFHDI